MTTFKDPQRDRKIFDAHMERCIFWLSPHEKARYRATHFKTEPTLKRFVNNDSYDMDPDNYQYICYLGKRSRKPSLQQIEDYAPNYWPKLI